MRGEHYILPVYNARIINPKYHTQPFYYKLIQQFIHADTDNNVVYYTLYIHYGLDTYYIE